MINAFMEGCHSAKKGKRVTDNPYTFGVMKDDYKERLWNEGFIFQLEQACSE